MINQVDIFMADEWTSYQAAKQLLNAMFGMNRVIASLARFANEEEATLMQVRALTHLIDHPITVSELAQRRKVSLQSVSALIQRLVDRGWVIRVNDPDDRRRVLLQVTPEGLARVVATENRAAEHLATYLDGLTPEEMAAARVFLPALLRVFAAHLIGSPAPKPETK